MILGGTKGFSEILARDSALVAVEADSDGVLIRGVDFTIRLLVGSTSLLICSLVRGPRR
jgi:hypothetical protein